jgi:hypothetical protein
MRYVAIITAATLLHGCVYIPGKVIDKVEDTLTGAEGASCVRDTAKVGDKLRAYNGDVMVVKSIYGPTHRCSDARFPVRALLVLEPQ